MTNYVWSFVHCPYSIISNDETWFSVNSEAFASNAHETGGNDELYDEQYLCTLSISYVYVSDII